jgi:DNA gyrase/topoisomerase IV subunit B
MSDNNEIIQLNYPDCIRQRPGMYIGSTENATVLLREVSDNSIDEAFNRTCTKIDISFNKDTNTYIISDNGRGLPVKPSKDNPSITQARLACEGLHTGSKFDKNNIQAGCNGVGISCVNALSSSFQLATRIRDENNNLTERFYICEWQKGILQDERYIVNTTIKDWNTIVTFTPDTSILESSDAAIPNNLKYSQYILRKIYKHNLDITINGQQYIDNISDLSQMTYVKLESSEDPNNKCYLIIGIDILEEYDQLQLDGSVNGLYVPEGLHINWVINSLIESFNTIYSTTWNRDQITRGLSVRVIAIANEPAFDSQTKIRLSTIKGFPTKTSKSIVDTISNYLRKLIKSNKKDWDKHNERIKIGSTTNLRLTREELIKEKLVLGTNFRSQSFMPKKLIDCVNKNRSDCELYCVEGNSAAGGLMHARDPYKHAIMPLRGKILNTTDKSLEVALNNQEVCDILSSIGCGAKQHFDQKGLRYGKIIIATDADADGFSIASLLLGMFLQHCPQLIELGIIYVANSPLYRVNDKLFYFGEEDKMNKYSQSIKVKKFQRWKGLGEYSPDEINEFYFDENTRSLINITMGNIEIARSLLTSASAKRELMINKGLIKFIGDK